MTEAEIQPILDKLDILSGDMREIKTVLLGVPNTKETGVVGKVQEIEAQCEERCAGMSKKEKTGLWSALIAGVVALCLGVIELFKR
ncbi:MAG: hypothetical protein WC479_12605 [Candidatus Izemoplasmatales bacterium]